MYMVAGHFKCTEAGRSRAVEDAANKAAAEFADFLRGYIEDIPRELEESALVDGCTRWQVLVRVILSWVAPDPSNPVVRVGIQITEPLMAPVRRLLPDMGGLDLSPLIVLLGVQLLKILFQLH